LTIVVAAALLGLLMSAQTTLDVGWPVRNVVFSIAAKRLRARHPLPETVERTYWTAWEYRKDAARLARLGYDEFSSAASAPYLEGASFRGRPGARFRVPIAHVIFRLGLYESSPRQPRL
jgi:hypothetical protein